MDLHNVLDQAADDLLENPTAKALVADVVGDHSVEWLEGFVYALQSNIAVLSAQAMDNILAQSTALSMLEKVLEQKKAEATKD